MVSLHRRRNTSAELCMILRRERCLFREYRASVRDIINSRDRAVVERCIYRPRGPVTNPLSCGCALYNNIILCLNYARNYHRDMGLIDCPPLGVEKQREQTKKTATLTKLLCLKPLEKKKKKLCREYNSPETAEKTRLSFYFI